MNMAKMGTFLFWFVTTTFGISFLPVLPVSATTKHFKFDIRRKNVTRLCHTRSILTVNGQFPGPPIVVREGDRVVVEVVNHVRENVSIHWHGVRQLRSGWYDGPEYITQCPIQQGQKYVYNFTITDQRGTLWWHAHVSWLRATLHGPIVILPKPGVPYPFPKPYKEVVMLFGEWFNHDTEAIIHHALKTGGEPTVSNAYTINGLPGPLYRCSAKDTFKLTVTPGKTYLLRLINAALNDELFFAIADHSLTVVEVDALYVKPFKTRRLIINPGQTTNVLLKAKPRVPNAKFLMEARPYESGGATFDATTVAGILRYKSQSSQPLPLLSPILPSIRDTAFVTYFSSRLRSLNSPEYPARVPRTVDRRFMFTVGLGTNPCPKGQICEGPILGTKFAASVNNVSFKLPSTAILQAHYYGRPNGVYTTDFPTHPAPFDYTGIPLINTNVQDATKVVVLPFNTTVELVMQDTSIISYENHPLHLHGTNFFILGQGFGNYDPATDPRSFNLVDPPERNTVGVPAGGWVAIRFLADNPGVWFMHCHLDVHLSWGLRMAWIVEDGDLPSQKLQPPPPDLPKC